MNLQQVVTTSIAMAQYPHPGDSFLWVVLRKVSKNEYATHVYNSQDNGFHNGHYFASLSEAREDYAKRVVSVFKSFI